MCKPRVRAEVVWLFTIASAYEAGEGSMNQFQMTEIEMVLSTTLSFAPCNLFFVRSTSARSQFPHPALRAPRMLSSPHRALLLAFLRGLLRRILLTRNVSCLISPSCRNQRETRIATFFEAKSSFARYLHADYLTCG